MISIATTQIMVSMEPSRGGKVTSLLHRTSGREWLEASDGPLEGPVDPDAVFDDGDMCGWDEMMPTIGSCRYPGTELELADHGELWRRSWDVTARDDTSVTTSVRDEVLDYRLERTMRVKDSSLRVEYRVTNESNVERALLWAAHPLFAHRPGTRIVLDGVHFDLLKDEHGTPIGPWPEDGLCLDDLATHRSQKLFVRVRCASANASLVDADGTRLTMRWARSDAPFVGIWLDNCSLSRHPVVALEPTNARHDALDGALKAGDLDGSWVVGRGRNREWRVDVELGA